MVDALLGSLEKISRSRALERIGVEPARYAVLTLHRPDNVDDPQAAAGILAAIERLQRRLPIVFPVHPRTRRRFADSTAWGHLTRLAGVRTIEPQGYVDFLRLVQQAAFVLTDSGGLQEESTVLGIPCLTLRNNTERPATLETGTNRLVGKEPAAIVSAARDALEGRWQPGGRPELWDGRASRRIVDALLAESDRIASLYSSLRRRTLCRRMPASVA
jgi:UDP-N-acetylglucosamine 2-epimerase (non-hydrolysing)